MSALKDPKNQKLINDFIAEHAPLINKNVAILKSKGLIPPGVEDEDLHFAGFHGLMDALHKYDPEIANRTMQKEENPFVKYAQQRIKGKILDHIAANDPIQRGIRTKAKNLATQAAVSGATPVEPTVQSTIMGKPPKT